MTAAHKNKNRRSVRNNKNRGNDAEQNAEKSEKGGKGERRGGYKKFDKRGAKSVKKASDFAPPEKRNTDSRADKTDGE